MGLVFFKLVGLLLRQSWADTDTQRHGWPGSYLSRLAWRLAGQAALGRGNTTAPRVNFDGIA
jgi:hypothetical protein